MRHLGTTLALLSLVAWMGAAQAEGQGEGNGRGGKGRRGQGQQGRQGRKGPGRHCRPPMHKLLEKFDKDGDGKLNEDERAAAKEAGKARQAEGIA